MNRKYISTIFLSFFLLGGAFGAQPRPGDFFAQGPASEKRISLTFDDGPGPHTEQFLDLLEKYNVKATFFMLGQQVQTRPRIAKLVFNHGHEIASHTYSHVNYAKRLKDLERKMGAPEKAKAQAEADLLADMKKTRQILLKNTGADVKICRMPHGIDRPWIKAVAKQDGVVLVNWTFGEDWTNLPLEKMTSDYKKAIQPGAILLFHDDSKHWEKTLQIVESVLHSAQEKGYSVVPVGPLLRLN